MGRTITLKIKYSDFRQITRNQSFPEPVGDKETILSTAQKLLLATEPADKKIRLLGISLSNFGVVVRNDKKKNRQGQLELFTTFD